MEPSLDRGDVAAQRCGDRVQRITRLKLEQQWHAIAFWKVVQRRPHWLGIGELALQCCCARDRFVMVGQWRHRQVALPPEMVVGSVGGVQ